MDFREGALKNHKDNTPNMLEGIQSWWKNSSKLQKGSVISVVLITDVAFLNILWKKYNSSPKETIQ
jgi:hypothetical protein